MKRILTILCIICISIFAEGQDLKTILAKNGEALGVENRNKIDAMQSNGYFIMTGTDAKMPFKLVQSKPDKVRIETSVFGLKAIQTYDGERAWLLNPTQGLDPKAADPEDMKFISATTSIDGPFKNLSEDNAPEYLGIKDYKEEPCFVVRVTKSLTEHFDYYISSKSYLINAIRYEYRKNGGWYSMEYKVEKYIDFEGAVFPEEVTVFINGVEMTSLFVTKLKLLADLDESKFGKPSY